MSINFDRIHTVVYNGALLEAREQLKSFLDYLKNRPVTEPTPLQQTQKDAAELAIYVLEVAVSAAARASVHALELYHRDTAPHSD